MPNFDQYLNDYMNIKLRRGVTPGARESEAVFKPYFDRQFDVNLAGRKQMLAENELATRTGQQGEALAWDKQKTMNELASTADIFKGELASKEGITRSGLATREAINTSGLTWDTEKAAKGITAEQALQTGRLKWAGEKSANEIALEKELSTTALDWSKTKSANQLALEKELQTGALGWNREKVIGALALERWKEGLLMDQAARNDTKATIGNVISTVGSVYGGVKLNSYADKLYRRRT
jgi:hypothetical protein